MRCCAPSTPTHPQSFCVVLIGCCVVAAVSMTVGAAPWIVRIVRTAVHDIAGTVYVESARARGEPWWRIAVVEVLPNLRALMLADAGVRLPGIISIVTVGGFLRPRRPTGRS